MPRLEESTTTFRYWIHDPAKFDKLQVKQLGKGVAITKGRIRGSERWEIQGYVFEKQAFANRDSVREWLDSHLKSEIQTLLDFRAWNEYRRQVINAYIQISKVSE